MLCYSNIESEDLIFVNKNPFSGKADQGSLFAKTDE